MSSAAADSRATTSRLVLVVGSGRSGTSTVAGALKYLGLHIPPPEVPPNPTNPRGFFEPRWVIDFQKRLAAQAGIHLSDSRPAVFERAAELGARPKLQAELRGWLSTALREAPELIVKDPRTSWFQPMWREAAHAAGVTPSFLTMLRHPAEVAGSKFTYYARNRSPNDHDRLIGDTWRIAGWINVLHQVEWGSRADPRAFVRYDDLLADWRTALASAGRALDLSYVANLDPAIPHEVDDFIDPNLHRVRVTWDDLTVPASIREIAESTWRSLGVLIDSGGHDEAAEAELDELRERYQRLHADAEAIAHHSIQAAAGTLRGGRPKKAEGSGPKNAAQGGGRPRPAQQRPRRSWLRRGS